MTKERKRRIALPLPLLRPDSLYAVCPRFNVDSVFKRSLEWTEDLFLPVNQVKIEFLRLIFALVWAR